MAMSKQDYKKIAKVLREQKAPVQLIEAMAAELMDTNPRFDFIKFMQESGVTLTKLPGDQNLYKLEEKR